MSPPVAWTMDFTRRAGSIEVQAALPILLCEPHDQLGAEPGRHAAPVSLALIR
jgi:hypothetical protein